MKAEEMREMTDDQLEERLSELKESLFRMRFKLSLGNTDVIKQLKEERKDLARVNTIITERRKAR